MSQYGAEFDHAAESLKRWQEEEALGDLEQGTSLREAIRVDTLAVVWQEMVAMYGAIGAPDVAMIKAARRLGVGDEFHALLVRGGGLVTEMTSLEQQWNDERTARLKAEDEYRQFREKLAALAALEDYMCESGENAARNMRDLLNGTGEHDNDPRVQARRWGLEF